MCTVVWGNKGSCTLQLLTKCNIYHRTLQLHPPNMAEKVCQSCILLPGKDLWRRKGRLTDTGVTVELINHQCVTKMTVCACVDTTTSRKSKTCNAYCAICTSLWCTVELFDVPTLHCMSNLIYIYRNNLQGLSCICTQEITNAFLMIQNSCDWITPIPPGSQHRGFSLFFFFSEHDRQ